MQKWEYVENHLTIPQIEAYRAYWIKNPPIHLLAAGRWGYKVQKHDNLPPPQLPDIEE